MPPAFWLGSANNLMQGLGVLVGGLLTDVLGPRPTLTGGSAILLGAGLLTLVLLRPREQELAAAAGRPTSR